MYLSNFIPELPTLSLAHIVRSKPYQWIAGAVFDGDSGAGCLIGHAWGYVDRQSVRGPTPSKNECEDLMRETAKVHECPGQPYNRPPYNQFDRLYERFGRDRVVRAVKKAAAQELARREEPAAQELLDSIEVETREAVHA